MVPRVEVSTEVEVSGIVVSTADVKPDIVIAEVVSSVVTSNVVVSKTTPVELTEGVVSIEVEPRVLSSAKVVPRVAVSAEVVSKVVISEVVPRLVVCAEVVVSVNGISKSILVLFNVVCSVCVGVLDESLLWVVTGVFSNSSQGRVGMASKSERSKSVANSTSAAAVVLVFLPGCEDTLEASACMVVPRVISGGLKGVAFFLVVGSGYEGVLDGSILGVILGVSSNSLGGRVGMTKSKKSKPVPNSLSVVAGAVVFVILPGCVDKLEDSAFSVVPRVISNK